MGSFGFPSRREKPWKMTHSYLFCRLCTLHFYALIRKSGRPSSSSPACPPPGAFSYFSKLFTLLEDFRTTLMEHFFTWSWFHGILAQCVWILSQPNFLNQTCSQWHHFEFYLFHWIFGGVLLGSNLTNLSSKVKNLQIAGVDSRFSYQYITILV